MNEKKKNISNRTVRSIGNRLDSLKKVKNLEKEMTGFPVYIKKKKW